MFKNWKASLKFVTLFCLMISDLAKETILFFSWLFFSNLSGQFFYCLLKLVYPMIRYLCKRFKPDAVPYLEEPNLDFILATCSEYRNLIRAQQKQHWSALKQNYAKFIEVYEKRENDRQIIFMDVDSGNPFYEETFQFLKNYFGIYRILPGIIPIDDQGIMHIAIQVLERKKDDLSFFELSSSLQLRLINALNHSNMLINISPGYWSESTVYFPDIERNLENGKLIALLALSKTGANCIKGIREQEKNPSAETLCETL